MMADFTDSGISPTKQDITEGMNALGNHSHDKNDWGETGSSKMTEGSSVEDDTSTLLHFKESEDGEVRNSRLHSTALFQISVSTSDNMLDKSALLIQRSQTPNQLCHHKAILNASILQEDASGDHNQNANAAEEEASVHSIEEKGKEERGYIVEKTPVYPLRSENEENSNCALVKSKGDMKLLAQKKKEVDECQMDELNRDKVQRKTSSKVVPIDSEVETVSGCLFSDWFQPSKEEVKTEDDNKDLKFELCQKHGHPQSLFCIACEIPLCPQCVLLTHFEHDVQEQDKDNKDLEFELCQKHGRPQSLFCTACEITLCPQCMLFTHFGHDVKEKGGIANSIMRKAPSKVVPVDSDVETRSQQNGWFPAQPDKEKVKTEEKNKNLEFELCQKHGRPQSFLCTACEIPLCRQCMLPHCGHGLKKKDAIANSLMREETSKVVPVDSDVETRSQQKGWFPAQPDKEKVKTEEDNKDLEFKLCQIHGRPQSHFCTTCEIPLCHQCMHPHCGHGLKKKDAIANSIMREETSKVVPVDSDVETRSRQNGWFPAQPDKENVKTEEDNTVLEFELCQNHGHPQSLFCTACEIPLCPQCVLFTHVGHGVKEKVDIANSIMDRLKLMLNSIASSKGIVKLHQGTAIKEHLMSIQQNTGDCLKKFREFKNAQIEQLNQEESRLQNEIAKIHNKKMEIWRRKTRSLNNVHKDLQMIVKQAELHRNPRIPQNFQQLLHYLNRGQRILDELPSLYRQVFSHGVDDEPIEIQMDPILNKWKFVGNVESISLTDSVTDNCPTAVWKAIKNDLDDSLTDCAKLSKEVDFKATEESDQIRRKGVSTMIMVRIQSVSEMMELNNWSFEEIRWSHYVTEEKIASWSQQNKRILGTLFDFGTPFGLHISQSATSKSAQSSPSIFGETSRSWSTLATRSNTLPETSMSSKIIPRRATSSMKTTSSTSSTQGTGSFHKWHLPVSGRAKTSTATKIVFETSIKPSLWGTGTFDFGTGVNKDKTSNNNLPFGTSSTKQTTSIKPSSSSTGTNTFSGWSLPVFGKAKTANAMFSNQSMPTTSSSGTFKFGRPSLSVIEKPKASFFNQATPTTSSSGILNFGTQLLSIFDQLNTSSSNQAMSSASSSGTGTSSIGLLSVFEEPKTSSFNQAIQTTGTSNFDGEPNTTNPISSVSETPFSKQVASLKTLSFRTGNADGRPLLRPIFGQDKPKPSTAMSVPVKSMFGQDKPSTAMPSVSFKPIFGQDKPKPSAAILTVSKTSSSKQATSWESSPLNFKFKPRVSSANPGKFGQTAISPTYVPSGSESSTANSFGGRSSVTSSTPSSPPYIISEIPKSTLIGSGEEFASTAAALGSKPGF